ncbi:MAG: hypothetical protein Q4F67_11165 [Propionibacteriaceae bacterium]|nr:hypothetical protein [Propionibacteriaceae bacterium]
MQRLVQQGLAATCAVGVLILTGCGTPPQAPPDAPGGFRSIDPNEIRTDPPVDPPSGAEFTLDQAAVFDDGVRFEVSSIAAGEATSTQTGAEGTDGHVVTAEITVTNGSDTAFDLAPIRVWGYYDEIGAPMIVDSTGAVGDRFAGTAEPGQAARARFGFAMPSEGFETVTIMIDGGTADHGIMQFRGPIG